MDLNPDYIKRTLPTIFRAQENFEAAKILKSANAAFEFLTHAYGRDSYCIPLGMPAAEFGRTEPRVEKIAMAIQEKCWRLAAHAKDGSPPQRDFS